MDLLSTSSTAGSNTTTASLSYTLTAISRRTERAEDRKPPSQPAEAACSTQTTPNAPRIELVVSCCINGKRNSECSCHPTASFCCCYRSLGLYSRVSLSWMPWTSVPAGGWLQVEVASEPFSLQAANGAVSLFATSRPIPEIGAKV